MRKIKPGSWEDNLYQPEAGKLGSDTLQRLTWRERLWDIIEENANDRNVSDDAENWNTCAVGERRQQLERLGIQFDATGQPAHTRVRARGILFADHVSGGQLFEALQDLDRLDCLIDEMRNSKVIH